MESDASLTNEFMDQILELSADAHVRRRLAVKDSPEFRSLTGAIKAYGTVLALLTALQSLWGFYERIGEEHLPDYPQWARGTSDPIRPN